MIESRAPVFPAHWISKQLNKVKNVVLWEGAIQEGESVRLVLSLLEQAVAAWEVDNLLGSAELILTNRNGHLEKNWKIPIFEASTDVEMFSGEPQRYVFKGSHAQYEVSFQVENQ